MAGTETAAGAAARKNLGVAMTSILSQPSAPNERGLRTSTIPGLEENRRANVSRKRQAWRGATAAAEATAGGEGRLSSRSSSRIAPLPSHRRRFECDWSRSYLWRVKVPTRLPPPATAGRRRLDLDSKSHAGSDVEVDPLSPRRLKMILGRLRLRRSPGAIGPSDVHRVGGVPIFRAAAATHCVAWPMKAVQAASGSSSVITGSSEERPFTVFPSVQGHCWPPQLTASVINHGCGTRPVAFSHCSTMPDAARRGSWLVIFLGPSSGIS